MVDDDSGVKTTVLDRAIDILKAFRPGESSLSLAEIAQRTQLPKSSTHRYVHSLMRHNLVSAAGQGAYRLGVGLWEIGALAIQLRVPLADIEPFAEDVANYCGETVHVGILDGQDVVYVVRVAGSRAVAVQTHLGQRVPAHGTATGKAILAWQSTDFVTRQLTEPLPSFTSVTPTTIDEVLAEAVSTRGRGYAANKGGWQTDMRGVAAPILGRDGHAIASIGIAGPAYRFDDDRMTELGEYVCGIAESISTRLGRGLTGVS